MLVLSRKPGQVIKITDAITIRITSIRGNHVSIAIDAPEDMKILRGELDLIVPGVSVEVAAPPQTMVA